MLYAGLLLTAARSISSSALRALSSSSDLHPICFIFSFPAFSASFSVAILPKAITEPLEPIALQKRFRDTGDAMSALTDIEPADSPAMVILSGSPPNAAMLSLSHCMAAA